MFTKIFHKTAHNFQRILPFPFHPLSTSDLVSISTIFLQTSSPYILGMPFCMSKYTIDDLTSTIELIIKVISYLLLSEASLSWDENDRIYFLSTEGSI